VNAVKAVKTVAIGMLLALTGSVAIAQSNAVPAATGPTMASAGTDSLAVARKYTVWFYTGQVDSLWAHQSADLKKDSSPAELMATLMQVTGDVGVEEKVIEERFVKRLGKTQYWRTGQFSGGGEPFMVRLALTPQGELAGFGFNPRSQAPATDP
jgi:hypothetical protein